MPDEFRRFLIASFHFYTKKKIRGTNADGNEKTDYISYQAAPLCIGLNYSPGLCSDCLCASQTYNGTNEETVKHTWTADGGEKVSFDRSSVNNKPTEDEQIYISLLLFLFFLSITQQTGNNGWVVDVSTRRCGATRCLVRR